MIGVRVSAQNHRVGRLSVVRIARRRPRRQVLLVRALESGLVGIRAARSASSAPTSASLPLVIGVSHDPVRADAARLGPRSSGRRRRDVRLSRRRAPSALLLFGDVAARPRVRVRLVVDGAERVLAARQPAAHPVQHVLGATVWGRRRRSSSGPRRTVIIYTVAGVCGFLLSSRRRSSSPIPHPAAAPASRSARRRRSSGCSARSCTTAGRAAAA